MNERRDVAPVSELNGKTVLSLATGNQIGQVTDVLIDPISGVLLGLILSATAGGEAGLPIEKVYNIGRDAIMAISEDSLVAPESGELIPGEPVSRLVGTKIITDSGEVLGQISDVFAVLKPPPRIFYEVQQSLLDRLLGRAFFIPASLGHALSDDFARLVVPDITVDIANPDLLELVEQRIEVRTYDTETEDPDETIPVFVDEDETVVRVDEEETLVRIGDDDDTVIRKRPAE